jgi:hypothetical protein
VAGKKKDEVKLELDGSTAFPARRFLDRVMTLVCENDTAGLTTWSLPLGYAESLATAWQDLRLSNQLNAYSAGIKRVHLGFASDYNMDGYKFFVSLTGKFTITYQAQFNEDDFPTKAKQ